MKINYDKLIELLNNFGLSLTIEGDNAIFTDIETDTPMKSYVGYKKGYADQKVEYTADTKTLLNGWPFYVENENKMYQINILNKEDELEIFEITKTERTEPHVYEETSLICTIFGAFSFDKTIYEKHLKNGHETLGGEMLSHIRFFARETDYDNRWSTIVTSFPVCGANRKKNEMFFAKNPETDEMTYVADENTPKTMSDEEAIQLIEQHQLFKDTLNIFCPILAENYENIKANYSCSK